jgi:hypothetical protein
MKLVLRISALTLVIAAAIAGNSVAKTPVVASNMHSSVPGGGGPMPVCNPFERSCPTIR